MNGSVNVPGVSYPEFVKHSHTAEEVGAAPKKHSHTAEEVGAAPEKHSHTAEEVGAAPKKHSHTAEEMGAAASNHDHRNSSVNPVGVELFPGSNAGHGGFIDFHYNVEHDGDLTGKPDYSMRLWQNAEGALNVEGGVLKVDGSQVLTKGNVIAVYNQSITFENGVATYPNPAVKPNSNCFVQRRAAAAGNGLSFCTTSNDGSLTIATELGYSATVNVNIIIINP